MTNNNAKELLNLCINLDQSHFNSDSKVDLGVKVSHALRRNIKILKSELSEEEEIIKTIQDNYKKKKGITDDDLKDKDKEKSINEDFKAYFKDKSKLVEEFLNKEYKGDIYKVSEEDIDDCVIPYDVYEYLLNILV